MISIYGIAFMLASLVLIGLILFINKYSKFNLKTTTSLLVVVICSYGITFLILYTCNDNNTNYPCDVLDYNKVEVTEYYKMSDDSYFIEALITYDDGVIYQCVGQIDKEEKYKNREIKIFISDINGEQIYTLSGDYYKHKDFLYKLFGENIQINK